ncbi:MAG: wax ester/triacylglycerol synthase family O-acyltransferase [Pseudomonadales bacterium]
MEQLSGLDAMFLHQEMDNAPMHIGPLFIYDPSTAPNGFVRYKDILATFRDRLGRSTVFRRKIAAVPLQLDQPYWVEDANFDLEFHVRHIALPKPGDWRQLCILVARLHSRPLDRSRPLWEAYVIEGLDGVKGLPPGSFAIFLKIHHAAIDGATGTEIMGAIHDLSPDPASDIEEDDWAAERDPSTLELLSRAYFNNIRQPFKLAGLIGESVPIFRRIRAGKKEKRFKSLGPKERTRFNGKISPHRVFGAVTFDLAEVRQIKLAAEGATVNDAILTVVGGGLRRYLAAKDELPEISLVTGAPVNVRTEAQKSTGGNMVSMMAVSFCSDVEDPVQRLHDVHGGAVESKAYQNAVGSTLMVDLSQSLPASLVVMAGRAASATGLAANMKPIFNTVVTNVPGPQVPLYMGGAKLVLSLGAGPCLDGMGLFHPVTSYNGMISVSFQACREMMPDPEFYAQCLQQSYDELKKAALTSTKAKPKSRAKTKARIKTRAKAKVKTVAKAKTKAKSTRNRISASPKQTKRTPGKKAPRAKAKVHAEPA